MPVPTPILLMTRPAAASERFVAELAAQATVPFDTVIAPLIGVTVTGPLPDLAGITGLIFTSAHGVAAFRALGGQADRPCWAVGEATARAAHDAGFTVRSGGGSADALVATIQSARPEAPLLHLRGAHARGAVAARLSRAGIRTDEAVVYDQPALPLPDGVRAHLDGPVPLVVPLFSPRTAGLFAELAPKAPLCVAAMSEAVAKPLLPLHIRHRTIAARPDSAAMLTETAALLAKAAALVTRQSRV